VIYLDHNATTPPSPGVSAAVNVALRQLWGNPSSVHRAGQEVRHAVELARSSLARLVGAKPRDLVLTGGGSESIDLAIRGVLAAAPRPGGDPTPTLVTSRIEHTAVRELAQELEKTGCARVEWLPVGGGGVVNLTALEAALARCPHLLSVQWANNETGVVQPIGEIAELCRAANARRSASSPVVFHVDGTQWVGKEPCPEPPCDLLTFAPHKFYGPKGVGVLYVRPGVRLKPRLVGAQELGRRGGTENVPGILGAGVAADEAITWLADASRRECQAMVRDEFEREVLAGVPGTSINSGRELRLWNTTNIAFPRLEAEALLVTLSERGVYASAGAACSSGSLEPSPVLLAMGIEEKNAHGSVRFSLGRDTTREEARAAARIVVDVARSLYQTLTGLGGDSSGERLS
jgi:cysteine desulfurase